MRFTAARWTVAVSLGAALLAGCRHEPRTAAVVVQVDLDGITHVDGQACGREEGRRLVEQALQDDPQAWVIADMTPACRVWEQAGEMADPVVLWKAMERVMSIDRRVAFHIPHGARRLAAPNP